ncbi:glycerophosphodiester phosphodiesterase family protein [Salinibacterium sp. ZJ454]|uniref:glycerophosphodiester phosphodiesterase family protein n=1 Tax=Salinibacterium sp. ZJ454 TaxID=2708339 RepID=UPI001FBA905F|nr:glycerophosphodiester phosphodiesterase family protein [Salinibacterium sp. ZJ454]
MYLSPAPPRVLAHRGFALDAPENSMLAFLRAVALGCSHLETDVHASGDGIAVICHDDDLMRIAGRPERPDQLSMARLAEVPLGHDQTMCSLSDALDAFPDARFNIDIKSADAVLPTVQAIRDAKARDRVLVTSFSERRRRAAVELLPGVATSASAPRFVAALLAAASGSDWALRGALRGLDALQVPEKTLGLAVSAPRILDAFHRAGVEVHIWTVNDVDDMARLFDAGVDGLVTDRPDLALRLLATGD